ncbi:hypothetical protein BX616_007480 [Lobosporangium transversale]|uniref:Signal transduction histidine kinase n=1 Tax=Lobosporangium transversale TaxID=64571 RepID=A0A1Y2GHY5_9FUNG|nr:signal transduction histidine kinase [Lobosporangium transversale]KAF9918606.1 hypothetical protein BX616_007480 [Lobosporangium transversale]ORZ11326.1 signal transduction histidine kinase [Lobosporangium transversale]|eukprot:XP_021879641.1 signal transduction histidine kinase [Lobosporangium transversale]
MNTTLTTQPEHVLKLQTTDRDNDVPSDSEADDDYGYDEDQEEEDSNGIIDHTTFDQLLEMDDEEDREFSKSLVFNYFEQAEQTFEELEEAMSRLGFADLSRLGHFLKGSSAALGLIKIKSSCERLQHYGNRKEADGVTSITNKEAELLIRALLIQMRKEYEEAKEYLKDFYKDGDE